MVTVSDGKHYSLGLDLELVTGGGVNMTQYLFDVQKLYRRLLTFPMVTVAAANGKLMSSHVVFIQPEIYIELSPHHFGPYIAGHIYAAGALFGLCHDYIIMNSSKGFFCLPEVTLHDYSSCV